MKIRLEPRYEKFRDEVRAFLDKELTDELRAASRATAGTITDYPHGIAWQRILHRRGWAAPSWPKEYGGPGWDAIEKFIFNTECGEASAPTWPNMGIFLCGPAIIGYGSDAQKARYLPAMLSGEDFWAQGYSEPGAGSDLASLRMRAESDGDDYILTGSKIWTTHAQYANRMFALARTADTPRPHDGISFLLLDMDTPGITVRPLRTIAGEDDFNEIFFDGVRVPKANRLGEENQGWAVAKYVLEFERGVSAAGKLRRSLAFTRRVIDDAGDAARAGLGLRMARAEIAVDTIEFMELRMTMALASGQRPGAASSILKLRSAELIQQLSEIALDAGGPRAIIDRSDASERATEGDARAQDILDATARYFGQRAVSIAGGTSEVQRNIIAKTILGL